MNIYQENIETYTAKGVKLKQQLNAMAFLRLFIFIGSAILLIALFSKKLFTLFWIVLPLSLFGFGLAIKRYQTLDYLKKHTAFLKAINESEILRDQGNFEAFDPGQDFMNPDHPYTSDLDIFGTHSIFQLINRTTTESGRMLLAKWLSAPASNQDIRERQQAITELAPNIDWRQDLQASGMHYQNKASDYQKLIAWVAEPPVLLKLRRWYLLAAILLSVLSLLGVYLFLLNLNSSAYGFYLLFLVSVLFINYLILRKVGPIADEIVATAQANTAICRSYQALIQKIEGASFQSQRLHQLQALLTKGNYSADREMEKLSRILDFSQQRGVSKVNMPIQGNAFYSILNSFLLIDVYLIIGVEKWKSRNKAHLESWADAVSELEVLNSLAGFYDANPSYTFPEITEQAHFIHFDALGHPLIHSDHRVYNDFHTEGPGTVVMITGSNMAGKSTFLRTVGVNLVLALTGAPCCTRQGQVSNLQLFSSMRTQDNLLKGVSSFFAELSRIETLLKRIDRQPNLYFLLDEMFKGTNSEDRHKGGFSLIKQFNQLHTSGIIATHDIDLAKLAGARKLVENYSFNSEIKEGKMTFSYQLHPHICNDFNASELMRRSGIDILSDISGG